MKFRQGNVLASSRDETYKILRLKRRVKKLKKDYYQMDTLDGVSSQFIIQTVKRR